MFDRQTRADSIAMFDGLTDRRIEDGRNTNKYNSKPFSRAIIWLHNLYHPSPVTWLLFVGERTNKLNQNPPNQILCC